MDDATPKKYIRTFASDIAALKSGGTPDLAPLRPAVSSGEGGLVESKSAPASMHEPIPVPLETYASDFSDRMKATHASTATVLAAEQDAMYTSPQEESRFSRKDFVYIFAGILLLVAGGFGAYFAYVHYLSTNAPVISAPIIFAPIFVDEKEQISGTGAALLSAIEQSVNRPLSSGTIRLLYTENATVSTSSPQATAGNSIFSMLRIPAPDIFLRNLQGTNSMTGVVNISGNQSPFFILSVASYGDTFSGMLSWEPSLTSDLGTLFPSFAESFGGQASSSVIATTIATTTTATTTSATATSSLSGSMLLSASTTPKTPVFVAGFRDEIVNNHDVRVYRDTENRSILLYGYWNQSTLIIARDPSAFSEIMLRLASSRSMTQ